MNADPGRRAGSHRLTWGGLRTTRNLIPEVVLYTPSGQERIIEIETKSDLLQLLAAGFDCLTRIEQAEQVRRAREVALAEAERREALRRRLGLEGTP